MRNFFYHFLIENAFVEKDEWITSNQGHKDTIEYSHTCIEKEEKHAESMITPRNI
jgi:hypothetical protein